MTRVIEDKMPVDPAVHVTGPATIAVMEEAVHVEKRQVETGGVAIHKTVSERDETVDMLLKRQDVSVERVTVGRVVQEAPPSRQEGDIWIVPVLEEVLVVEKRLVLKEELHIRTTTVEQPVQRTVRLRTEHAEIEQFGTGPSAQSTP